MNIYLSGVFHQMKVAIDSVNEIIQQLSEADLDYKPIDNKRTIRELLCHIALICKADYLILNEATQEEMKDYYDKNTKQTINEIKEALIDNYTELVEQFLKYSIDELSEYKQSYWGLDIRDMNGC
ncbi:DinB family protein [Paenibacillus sp. D2_2]|uniref:DinB family protein n=1 Tax=Paenibacillus sp. D2_2 TaxID=3073092 RepID=UPI00281511C5|nr:DinB family protein [Paenibacillus sp. D2_2]WMT39666.1 DinB family protein [Paenibacillus sp. D2_2]